MIRRHGARPAALLAPVAVLLLLQSLAHAQKVVTEDGTGDARAWTDHQRFEYVPAPDEASVDISRTVASFGHHRLRVTVHFRDLEVRALHTTALRIRTSRDTYAVTAERASASRAKVTVKGRRDGAFECRGLRVRYDGPADTVSLSVPARCLGAPRWVRLGVRATATPRSYADDPGTVFFLADDGHRDTFRDGSIGLGPRVARG